MKFAQQGGDAISQVEKAVESDAQLNKTSH